MSEQVKLLIETAEELVWLHRSYVALSPLSEGVPRITRLIQKIAAHTGREFESPYRALGGNAAADRVDMAKVRALIAEMRGHISNRDNQSTLSIESWADEIEAALGGKENSDE